MKLDHDATVHCLFEQSGTFKRAFREFGFGAEDYDLQDNFGETDHIIDIFAEIENAYDRKPSIFDRMERRDLIMAFFPCIYFCDPSQCAFRLDHINYRKKSLDEKAAAILQRSLNREHFFRVVVKMCIVALRREIPLIMENPYSGEHFLKNNFIARPAIIDMDRSKRGDSFKKPTAYWFFGCEPTHSMTA